MNRYWESIDPPMAFTSERWTYVQKRAFRYEELNYLHGVVDFDTFTGRHVLCVGEGSGIDAVEFAHHGASVSVLDLSSKAVDLTRSLFTEVSLLDHLCGATVGDICRLPYGDCMFDAVYALGVLHHLIFPERAVGEILRVLKPGGEFLGMVYHRDSLLYAYSILLRAHVEGLDEAKAMSLYSERIPECPFSRVYSRNEAEELLSGFKRTKITTHYPVIDMPEERKVRFTVSRTHSLGWHLFFRAERAGILDA